MAQPSEAIRVAAEEVSTKHRLRIFRDALPPLVNSSGSGNVQAAQKFISGLDARRLSKLSENSDGSDNSEDDTANI